MVKFHSAYKKRELKHENGFDSLFYVLQGIFVADQEFHLM